MGAEVEEAEEAGVDAVVEVAPPVAATSSPQRSGRPSSPASTAAPLDIWLASWNGIVALGLGVVSLAVLMRWRRG